MTDESATTPVSETSNAVREWASDWADKFDQDWGDDKLAALVGKNVSGRVDTSEGPKGFENVLVVGHSIDTIIYEIEDGGEEMTAHRFSLLTSEGKQLPIFAGMEIVEVAVE